MSSSHSPQGWIHPEYVATVTGGLATGAFAFYSAIAQSGPTVEEIICVVLTITVPTTTAYEPARRWQ